MNLPPTHRKTNKALQLRAPSGLLRSAIFTVRVAAEVRQGARVSTSAGERDA